MRNGKYTCLDLFSGAGGLSRGFYDAGYDVVLGVDFDEAALKTFKENHGSAEAINLGANYMVIGRPITQADDPNQALKNILSEINT